MACNSKLHLGIGLLSLKPPIRQSIGGAGPIYIYIYTVLHRISHETFSKTAVIEVIGMAWIIRLIADELGVVGHLRRHQLCVTNMSRRHVSPVRKPIECDVEKLTCILSQCSTDVFDLKI
jgi:hypothetical protein